MLNHHLFGDVPSGPARADTLCDDLFNTLDGEAIVVGERTWRLRLYSVCTLDDAVWMQLDLVGKPTYVLTLQQERAEPASVLATLSRYLDAVKDAPCPVFFDQIMSSQAGERTASSTALR